MKQDILVLNTLSKEETLSLSAKLSVMVLETVDSLYTHQCQTLCRRYQLRNGAFSRVKKINFCPVTTCNCGRCS